MKLTTENKTIEVEGVNRQFKNPIIFNVPDELSGKGISLIFPFKDFPDADGLILNFK